ncbi:hypothetical protein ACWGJ2_10565 [Streptomyces sp. NPDC054796]|uniref:Uncharacterized protein n=1 Tax=Streptomyces daliensis TaxID=299421 RepID=A0A8T4J6X2_9ACTN|nr:hypothetical protein [Streptomyces daliensis]
MTIDPTDATPDIHDDALLADSDPNSGDEAERPEESRILDLLETEFDQPDPSD